MRPSTFPCASSRRTCSTCPGRQGSHAHCRRHRLRRSHGDVAPAYESSWLAARLIADRYGERKLVRLYVSFADRDNGPADGDIRAVLGISEKKLIKDWRAYMKSLASVSSRTALLVALAVLFVGLTFADGPRDAVASVAGRW
jgi:hypothetical protein